MFATLKKPLALALVTGLVACLFIAPDSQPVEAASREFKGKWKKISRDQMDAMARNTLATELASNDAEEVENLTTVMGDRFWTVRIPAINKIRETTDKATLDAWLEVLYNKRTTPGVQENIAYALARRSNMKEPEWALLRMILDDEEEKVTYAVREVVARRMSEYPYGSRPPRTNHNDNAEKKKQIAEQAAKINEFTQPIMKATLQSLYKNFVKLSDEKLMKKKKKDPAFRKLRWSIVNAMEQLTSQEFGENVTAWKIWLTQTNFDKPSGKLKDLEYKWRTEVDQEVDNVKLKGSTAVRKKKRRNTNTELILLPQQGYDVNYFFPFMNEFTHYFDVSSFKMPRAEKIGKPAKMRDGSVRQDAYYYPTAAVAKAFDSLRKKMGGNKNIGMFCHGGSCFVGMEYAANNPDNCAFLIVVGGWGTNANMGKAIQQCKSSQNLELKYYGMINRTNYGPAPVYPEPFTPEKRFLGDTGDISHQFSDPFNTDQYVLRSIGRDRNPERGRKSSLIDESYSFKAKKKSKVPALFIWGEDDPMYVREAESHLKKQFSNITFVKMKGVSRTPWLEDPIGFFDHIENFMDKKRVWKRIDKANEKKGIGGKKKKK